MAFSIAACLQAGLLLLMLSRHVPFLSCRELWPTVWKTSLACLVALIFAYPVRQWVGTVYQLREVWQLALQAGLTMVVGGVSFSVMLFLSKSRELAEMRSALVTRLWRKANLGESAEEAGRT
jgi:peptidoglycan biosynthesis protein MviN/MurJ (putative lipid II flippase)